MQPITRLFRSASSWRRICSVRPAMRGPARRSRRRPRPFLPLETLEERIVLSTLMVTTALDVVDGGDGDLSLREAMLIANDNTGGTSYDGVSSSDVADAIVFDEALLDPVTGKATISLNGTQLPTITSDLMITGLGAEYLTIDAQNASLFFVIAPGVTAQFEDLTPTGGHAAGIGGAIYNVGQLTVTGCTFSDNSAGTSGGAIFNQATLTVSGCTFSSNSADRGGAIDNFIGSMLTVTGSTFSGNAADAGGAIWNTTGTLTVTGSTFSGNSASNSGGAIYNGIGTLTVTGSTFNGNLASGNSFGDGGGAIYNSSAPGRLTVTGSTFSGNSANARGGAIFSYGRLTVTGSTLSGNSANFVGGAIFSSSDGLTVTGSTFSGNSTNGVGGAIYHYYGTLTVSGSTIVLNRADADGDGSGTGGGIYNNVSITLSNTIVAGNFLGTGTAASDLAGFNVAAASSHNLIGDAASSGGLVNGDANGNIVGVDIATVLDTTLADNGGPTLTHALVAGSPAIDAGDNSLIPPDQFDLDADGDTTEPIPFDQRGDGFARIVGGTVDIGAFELLQNQAPVVSDFTKVGAEDNTLTFTTADFTTHYSDPDGDALVSVRIEMLPANGTLLLNGVAVIEDQVVEAADLGNLVFVPALDFNGTTSFTYTASDGVSGFALAPATVTLHIQSAAEQAAAIATQIDALLAEGQINQGKAKALSLRLKDNPGDVGKVGAFLNKLDAFVRGGILSEEEAALLSDLGNMLLVSLTTG